MVLVVMSMSAVMGFGGPAEALAIGAEPPLDGLAATVAADPGCLPRPTAADHTAILGGVTDDGASWTAGFGEDETGIQMVCVTVTDDGHELVNGLIGGPFEPAESSLRMTVGVMDAGVRDGRRWNIVRGAVTDRADSVAISIDGADPVEAELASAGPADGWLWFAIAVAQVTRGFPKVRTAAYDADGGLVATGHDPWH